MIVTENFVMLNNPKTGSTFSREVIKEIYKNRDKDLSFSRLVLKKLGLTKSSFYHKELVVPNIKITGVKRKATPHGTYTQIPFKHRNKKVVSIVRNPYDRFLTMYHIPFWRRNPPFPKEIIQSNFPNFPSLSFDEFVDWSKLTLIYGRLGGQVPKAAIGDQSAHFIQMFFKNPQEVLLNVTDEYIDSDRIYDDLADITFLRQEYLNNDLMNFLANHGYQNWEIKFIEKKDRIHATKNKKSILSSYSNRHKLWTPKTLHYINHHERLIFKILRRFDIVYTLPETN